jgi:Mg-chelatase subunit ChlD
MKFFGVLVILFFALTVPAQTTVTREFDLKTGGALEIRNLYGRVSVSAEESNGEKVFLTAQASRRLAENELKTAVSGGKLIVTVAPTAEKTRVDLTLKIPLYSRLKIETGDGEVRIAGEIESADVKTETGTIATDVPLENLKYSFLWTSSRPRYLSDVELEEVNEKSGGKFSLSGRIGEKVKKKKGKNSVEENQRDDETTDADETAVNRKSKNKDQKTKNVTLNFTTARGIVLLNVNPSEVPSDLRERPLTEAAKAIIRSGDSLLTEAIRRASPKFFGDYAKTLPPRRREPSLSDKPTERVLSTARIKRVTARVMDANNRTVSGLQKADFTVLESGREREILSVEPVTAPFNLVLLLDVSGSVKNYVDFTRKAARAFINTMNRQDRIAILTFNEDVKVISNFTTDRARLSAALDSFEAGGGTAYYDALAYSLVETLRPLRGERTAIVILSDGDDNRSFLPFESLLGSIQESGALIYPLYVPSGLVAASAQTDSNATVDPLRSRYMALTSKAEAEGARLAEISGGVYYPIRRLEELQKAYDDIVVQLRTAYTITFRSDSADTGDGVSPRLRVRTNRAGTFVNIGNVTDITGGETSQIEKKIFTQKAQSESAIYQTFSTNFNPASFVSSALNFNFASFAPLPSDLYEFFADESEEISAEVERINYKQFVNDTLREWKIENFDINKAPGAFLLANDKEKIAVSRWISPKRTRSYPYERVYDTLAFDGKRVAVIPVVKDEGLGGERDFLQWDTISLLERILNQCKE